MKFCEKCGKEIMDEAVICPNCGCPVASKSKENVVTYDDCVCGAVTTNIIAAILLVLGVVCGLFFNALIGCALCLASEFVSLIPTTKLQKSFKRNNHPLNKKELKTLEKQTRKE